MSNIKQNESTLRLVVFVFLFLIATSFSLASVESFNSRQHELALVDTPNFIAQDLSNLTDVGLFIDSTISQQLSTYRIRGAQVSVVKDGQLYFSNGYGFYHNDTGPQPVTANTSLFMVASLSKALTATAIMQLV
ncbi:MAG: serine hydrolase, partial [Candidatus Thorarchaeota archaeon]